MARFSWPVNTCCNDTKRQRPAGMRYDELHANATRVQNVENRFENNGKYRTSHISSNGYYGYLPVIPDIEDYAMDTSDAGAENIMGNGTDPKDGSCISTLTKTENVNVNVMSVGITLGRRKRNSEEDNSTEEPKRQRKGEQDSLSEKVSESSLQFIIEGCDLDLVEKLLKGTHGCDLYHYDACDI